MPPAPVQRVPVSRQRFRLTKIDAAPYATPDQVKSLVAPAFERALTATAGTQIVLKGGELADVDHTKHSSHFIGICYPAGSHPEETRARSIFNRLREECQQIRIEMRLPVIEIPESHPGYRTLVSDLGWEITGAVSA